MSHVSGYGSEYLSTAASAYQTPRKLVRAATKSPKVPDEEHATINLHWHLRSPFGEFQGEDLDIP